MLGGPVASQATEGRAPILTVWRLSVFLMVTFYLARLPGLTLANLEDACVVGNRWAGSKTPCMSHRKVWVRNWRDGSSHALLGG